MTEDAWSVYWNHQMSFDDGNPKGEAFRLDLDRLVSGVNSLFIASGDKAFLKIQRVCFETLVLNILHHGVNVKIRVSRKNGSLPTKSPYYGGYGDKVCNKVQDKLSQIGLLNIKTGQRAKNKKNRIPTTIFVTQKFAEMLLEYFNYGDVVQDNSPLVILSRKKGAYKEHVRFIPNDTTRRREVFLKNFNDFISKQKIGLDEWEVDEEVKFLPSKTRLVSIFNTYEEDDREEYVVPRLGGRLYRAWWMEIASKYREHILINNQPTVEYDFVSMQINMLYMDYSWEVFSSMSNSDPYDAVCLPSGKHIEDQRKIIKTMLNIMLNTKSVSSAEKAFIHNHKKKNNVLKKHELSARDVIYAIYGCHPIIKEHEAEPVGLQLQYQDSEIMVRILSKAMEKGIPVLPVHDACIVPEQHSSFIKNLMYEELLNYYATDPSEIDIERLVSLKKD